MRALPFAVALLVALAGCSALAPSTNDPPDEPQIFRGVVVDNYDDIAHTVDIVILHDGNIVYWTTHRLGAASNHTIDGFSLTPPGIENTTREYTVLIRLDNRTTGVRYPPRDAYQGDCYSVGADIRDGELTGPVTSHWADRYCSKPTTTSS